jgi:hypothetical protein
MEIIKFIFSNFWIWLGTVIIIGTFLDGIADIVKNIKDKK